MASSILNPGGAEKVSTRLFERSGFALVFSCSAFGIFSLGVFQDWEHGQGPIILGDGYIDKTTYIL